MYIVVFLQFLPVHIGIRNYGIFQFRILSALKETVFWGFLILFFGYFVFWGGGGVFKGVGVLVGEGEGTTHGGTPVIHSEVPGKTPYPTTWWKTAVMTIQHSLVIKLATSHVVSATVRTVKVTAMKDGKQQRWGRAEGEDWVTL